MKVLIPIWRGRVSPLLDVAGRFLLVRLEGGREEARREIRIDEKGLVPRSKRIVQLGTDVLICGALSRPLEESLVSEAVRVIPYTCGAAEQVLRAFRLGQFTDGAFLMPGCTRQGHPMAAQSRDGNPEQCRKEEGGGGPMSDAHTSFFDVAVVSCGTLSLELNHLRKSGFLDTPHLFYTTPGLHERPQELERQLIARIRQAKERLDKVIVVYGGKFCYINVDAPTRKMQTIIAEEGPHVARIQASHCIDMLISEEQREEIAQGEKVWWMTPGWIKFRHEVFRGWDKGLANENFPRHTGGAIVADGIDYYDQYVAEHPEDLLEYSDWMGIPIQSHTVSLDRFKALLLDQLKELNGNP